MCSNNRNEEFQTWKSRSSRWARPGRRLKAGAQAQRCGEERPAALCSEGRELVREGFTGKYAWKVCSETESSQHGKNILNVL